MNTMEKAQGIEALGGEVTLHASGEGVDDAISRAREIILELHDTLTRFDPKSELSRLNADPRPTVPVSPIMLRFLEAVQFAGELSGGLVDASCLDAVERSGYTHSLSGSRAPGGDLLTVTEFAEPAGVAPGTWRDLEVDALGSTVTRPPGLRFDAGGLGKGIAADMASERLCHLDSYAVDCLGELRFGGTAVGPRQVSVASPDPRLAPIASLNFREGAIATSGITKRSWVKRGGKASHHLIDPRTGEPVFSGLLQVTALAPTALEAEIRAKSALISGPETAMEFLPDGGVVVFDDFRVQVDGEFRKPDGHR